MFNFYPKEYIKSVYEHDFSSYADYGFRAILFDIDNTLTLHDEEANDFTKFYLQSLKNLGYKIGVVSNNGFDRVAKFAQDCNIDIFIYEAKKPLPDALFKVCEMLSVKPSQIIFVGDQIFADVLFANNAGAYMILTKPFGKEKYFRIKLKRILEKPFLFLINRRLKNLYLMNNNK